MSSELFGFARQFALGEIPASEFADEFMRRWEVERDTQKYVDDPPARSEALSSIFCLADLYNPDSDREEYELDESTLSEAVRKFFA